MRLLLGLEMAIQSLASKVQNYRVEMQGSNLAFIGLSLLASGKISVAKPIGMF